MMCIKLRRRDENGSKIVEVEEDKNEDDLEESGVQLVEGVDVGEEEGEGLLRHRVLFRNLVPEPLIYRLLKVGFILSYHISSYILIVKSQILLR